MSCEFSFIPIQSKNYTDDVNKVLQIIESSGLEYSVNEISTIVKGNVQKVFALVQEIYKVMDANTKFTIAAKFSNVCGCSF